MDRIEAPPILRTSLESPAVFQPQDLLRYFLGRLDLECVDAGEACLFTYSKSVSDRTIGLTGAVETEQWVFRGTTGGLYNFHLGGRKTSVLPLGFGAPCAATMMEVLIASGVKDFIAIGSAATLQHAVAPGDIVIAKDAIRGEGVSYYYLPPGRAAAADGTILSALAKACRDAGFPHHVGTTWTTDALFRESIAAVSRYRDEGVLAIDMEAAALYAVARFRNVRCCSLFYVSDSLAELSWDPRFFEVGPEAAERCVQVALNALGTLRGAEVTTPGQNVREV